MKKKTIACILALGVTISATGCSLNELDRSREVTNKTLDDCRFVNIETSVNWDIFYDSETKVIYFRNTNSYGGGISPLLDSEGNVQFYQG